VGKSERRIDAGAAALACAILAILFFWLPLGIWLFMRSR
jgi:hypothetical protein